MTKKIQKAVLFIVFVSVVLCGVGFSYVFYETSKTKEIQTVKNQVNLVQTKLKDKGFEDMELSLNQVLTQSRITLIDKDGVVLFDNKVDVKNLDNHNNRAEVINARLNGVDEEERTSDSLDVYQYYYAVLLDNDNVLRISTEINSYYSLFMVMLPFMLVAGIIITILAAYISRTLTRNIVGPIEEADLKSTLSSPYRELDVYFNTMREQKTEIERQLLRVNKRKETINTILNTMQEGFLIVDERKDVFLANQAFLEMTHLNDYSVGDSIFRFISDTGLLQRIHGALRGKSSSYKIEIDNRIYQVYISHTRLIDEDVAILLFVDISLEYANQKHREEFSANVSHELKTPLTSIKGLAELQANNLVAPKDIQEFGAKILKQSDRLLELIDHTIRLSKFDEDMISLEKKHINLNDLIKDVEDNLESKLKEKNITITNNIDNVILYANYQMMDELFFNLIDNAIKYNNQNGWVKIIVKDLDKEVYIEVSDGGPQIPRNDLPRIFERFYRVDSSRDKKTGGTGLGLAIVKHIIMYHEGSVEVVSDSVTKFMIHLPKL